MRKITKTEPPQEFIEYCQTPGVTYGNLSGPPKSALRQRLLEDQGYICCYCGCRIENNNYTIIEHIKCQQHHSDLDLDFTNMLVSCDGGEKDRAAGVIPKHNRHCGPKKDNIDIPISPLDYIDGLLSFFDDGTVKGEGDLGKELVSKLGLDVPYLNTQRRKAIAVYDDVIPEDLQKELQTLKEKKDGKFCEFNFVLEQHIIDLMNQKIANTETTDK